MTVTLLPFGDIPWDGQGCHPLERKKVVPGSGAILLRFDPGFCDPKWCERSHVLYVLEGTLTLDLDEGSCVVEAGSGIAIPSGTRHRAANRGDRAVVLFIVSDV